MAHNAHQRIGDTRLGHKDAKSMKRSLHPAIELRRQVVDLLEEPVYAVADDVDEKAV